jgi:Holliday junction resolvase RusA-like endonuclease
MVEPAVTDTVTIRRTILPCVPDADLSPNARVHWRVRARKVRALREFVCWSSKADAPSVPLTGKVVLHVAIGWPKGRKRHDPTNVPTLLKAVVDGLTDAGWWEDDRLVEFGTLSQQTWGQWEKQGGWLFPGGVMTVDIEQPE